MSTGARRPPPPPLREPDAWTDIEITPAAAFGDVDEPGAESLLGTVDQNLIPVGGEAMLYGDGGTGKTTLAIDLAVHLAAGADWLGIPVQRPARVLLIENEGPRPLFRRKLRRKLSGWDGPELDGRLLVWAQPWAGFTFAEQELRAQLARAIYEHELDLVVAGPVTQLGMDDAGTLQEVRNFAALVAEVRGRALRPVGFLLVHHENKGGRVSGAWEGVGDTMLHVQGSGHGKTRVFVQKARWGSNYHARTFHLTWAGDEAFGVDESATIARPERTWADIEKFVLEHPGCNWNDVKAGVTGTDSYLGDRRDSMLAADVLVDVGKGSRYALWHRDDPARPQELDDGDAEDAASVREAAPGAPNESDAASRTDTAPPHASPSSGVSGGSGAAVRDVRTAPLPPHRSTAPETRSETDDDEDW
jgi:hypothetical protein